MSFRDWVNPRAIVRLWLGQWKVSMTPLGIEPMTFFCCAVIQAFVWNWHKCLNVRIACMDIWCILLPVCSVQVEVIINFSGFDCLLPSFWNSFACAASLVQVCMFCFFFYLNCEEDTFLELQPSECTMSRLALLLLFYLVYGSEL